MIPDFNDDGLLPSGIHEAESWEEIEARLDFSSRRKQLINGLKLALKFLKEAGCKTVYIDGSFATTKENPGDYDICWDEAGIDFKLLKQRCPVMLDFNDGRKNQKIMFGGEIFPSKLTGNPHVTFIDFFQKDKNDNPKGIIKYNL